MPVWGETDDGQIEDFHGPYVEWKGKHKLRNLCTSSIAISPVLQGLKPD